jgi:hypothetical protein|uniref:Uncharacterized protein n=1 Tax=Sipha flava TaxID=143950 RepID=A0A2S2QVG4_9HEMI
MQQKNLNENMKLILKLKKNTSVVPLVQPQIIDQQLQISNANLTESNTNLSDSLDIEYFVNDSKTADNYIKYLIFKISNFPESNFCWPYSNHSKKRKIELRYLHKNHYEKYP